MEYFTLQCKVNVESWMEAGLEEWMEGLQWFQWK